MQFSVRDLAMATMLLSFYLAVLTRLWASMVRAEQTAALLSAGLILALVMLDTVVGEFVRRLASRRLLTIFRPQRWWLHSAMATPVLVVGILGIRTSEGIVGYTALYTVLCAFSVHWYLCVKPLVAFTSTGITLPSRHIQWSLAELGFDADHDPAVLAVGRLGLYGRMPPRLVEIPADRVTEVLEVLAPHLPEAAMQLRERLTRDTLAR